MVRTILIFLIFSIFSCSQSDQQKLNFFKKNTDFYINIKYYGGITGSGNYAFHFKKKNNQYLIIANEHTDFQHYITLDSTQKVDFDNFLDLSLESHDPNRTYIVSCIGGLEYEYELQSNFTTLHLKPNHSSSILFLKLTKDLRDY